MRPRCLVPVPCSSCCRPPRRRERFVPGLPNGAKRRVRLSAGHPVMSVRTRYARHHRRRGLRLSTPAGSASGAPGECRIRRASPELELRLVRVSGRSRRSAEVGQRLRLTVAVTQLAHDLGAALVGGDGLLPTPLIDIDEADVLQRLRLAVAVAQLAADRYSRLQRAATAPIAERRHKPHSKALAWTRRARAPTQRLRIGLDHVQ